MATSNLRQTARASSLEAARVIYLLIVALSVRQSLLFLLGETPSHYAFWIRVLVVLAFLFTLFRYSHGIVLVYEMEKRIAEQSTVPSSKRVELVFALFSLEGIAFFLMASRLENPRYFAYATFLLLLADLGYISASKANKDTKFHLLFNPRYLWRRWHLTDKGTAARTHLQWAMSDQSVGVAFLLTFLDRPRAVPIVTGNWNSDWAAALALILGVAGAVDYLMNSQFYFGRRPVYRKRKCVFVCSRLKPTGAGAARDEMDELYENIRRAAWYCRQLYGQKKVVPFASHVFYPYFLDDTSFLDRKLGRQCAIEFLAHCDGIYVYTPNASGSEESMSQGMREEYKVARENGLEIKFCGEAEPPKEFRPEWAALSFKQDNGKRDVNQAHPEASGMRQEKGVTIEIDLEKEWKKVFVCTPLRQDVTDPNELRKTIEANIRLAQWLCHQLVHSNEEGGKRIAPFAPQAFYPYFTDFDEQGGLQWLESALDILKLCDAIYVYTKDGLENKAHLSKGMLQCVSEARELGMEIKFRRITEPPEDWKPAAWSPVKTT